MGTEVVLFDLGGVLIELSGTPTLPEWTQLTDKEVWQHWLSSPAVRNFESGGCSPENFSREIVVELGLKITAEEFLHRFAHWPQPISLQAVTLVEQIQHKGLKVACLSNTNDLHWQRFQSESSLIGLFDTALASHQTGHLKPDSTAFNHAIEELQVAPDEVLFLDDNQINVDAALDCGIDANLIKGLKQVHALLLLKGIF